MAQIHYEDIQEAADIPTLEKTPTTRTLVQWAGASGDFFELHYDKEFVKSPHHVERECGAPACDGDGGLLLRPQSGDECGPFDRRRHTLRHISTRRH